MKDKNGVEIRLGDIVTIRVRAGVTGFYSSGSIGIRVPYQTYALSQEELEVDVTARQESAWLNDDQTRS